eukprot:141682_1
MRPTTNQTAGDPDQTAVTNTSTLPTNPNESAQIQGEIAYKLSQTEPNPRTKDNRLDYEVFQWIFIVFFTLITIIDRFTVNLWPLWVDSPGPTIPGNFGVSVFAMIAWISSRMMLVSSSYIFLFQCRVFWNWFCEQPFANKYLKIGDITQTNVRIHYHVGWALIGVPCVLHVWAIMFAAAFPQNEVTLYPNWMRPNDPDGKSIPFYADNLLSLGINDVYRIVSTSVTFFILIPMSIISVCRNRNWSRAQWLHFTGALIYTVDLIRMKSHPHCWVFNLPFIIWWMMDRFYGIFFYRRAVVKIVHKVVLDDRYSILYLRVPRQIYQMRTIGDVLYVNFLDPKWDRAHPFTVFWNHENKNKMIVSDDELAFDWMGHKFRTYRTNEIDEDVSQYAISRQSTRTQVNVEMNVVAEEKPVLNNDMSGYDWDVAVIMQVFPNRNGCLDHRKSWTQEVMKRDLRELIGLRTWGPYRSEYRDLVKKENQQRYPVTPLVLIGTGCGCSYLIDFYQYISSNAIQLDAPIYFYFSTRSIPMFQWFTDITCHERINNLFVNAHITSHDNIIQTKPPPEKETRSRDSKIGRLNVEQILNMSAPDTEVFYCGCPEVSNIVLELCKKYKLYYHAGHSFY